MSQPDQPVLRIAAARSSKPKSPLPSGTCSVLFYQVPLAVFFLCLAAGIVATKFMDSPIPVVSGVVVGTYLMIAIKVIDQWEKVVVLRFGRYRALRGPGLVVIVPILDKLSRDVDQRVRVSSVSAESRLTRDTVPVSVDAILF
jgi:hypothetical protein